MLPLLLIQLTAAAAPTFHAFWLVNLNEQVGPTPQQPSPK